MWLVLEDATSFNQKIYKLSIHMEILELMKNHVMCCPIILGELDNSNQLLVHESMT